MTLAERGTVARVVFVADGRLPRGRVCGRGRAQPRSSLARQLLFKLRKRKNIWRTARVKVFHTILGKRSRRKPRAKRGERREPTCPAPSAQRTARAVRERDLRVGLTISHAARSFVARGHLARAVAARAPLPSRGHILTRPLARDTRPARALKHPRGGADPTTRRW